LEKPDRILVCITPQSNGARLIDKGFETAAGGDVHILYIEKGADIFSLESAPALLQELFDYGAEKGGVIHAQCGDNITDEIRKFIKKEDITHVILGEPPKNANIASENVIGELRATMPHIKLVIMEREDN